MLANLITLLHSDGFICSAYCLTFLALGFSAGWYSKKYKNDCQTKLKDPEQVVDKCPLLGGNFAILSYKNRMFLKPKITHTTCEFFKNGICSKNNQTCHLLKGYKKDHFAF